MIFGVGTDIVDVKRIKKMKSINSFAKKILGDNENIKFLKLSESNKIFFIAKQFAGKEAFAKAIGTGISGDINFKTIEILRNDKGKPIFKFAEKTQLLLDNLGIAHAHVSLSDEKEYALAFVILEK
jgi:holo-[acyl-carrier protein] synthase